MVKIAVAGKINSETYKKIEQFQKKNKIKTKSQALDIILYDYFNSTDKRGVTLRLPQSKTNCRMILSGFSFQSHINELKSTISKMEHDLK